jgi:hypothetical protein
MKKKEWKTLEASKMMERLKVERERPKVRKEDQENPRAKW